MQDIYKYFYSVVLVGYFYFSKVCEYSLDHCCVSYTVNKVFDACRTASSGESLCCIP